MHRFAVATFAVVACATVSARADVVTAFHAFTFNMQQDGPAYSLRPHPNVVQFLGATQVGWDVSSDGAGGVKSNPLYQGGGNSGNNPLFQGRTLAPDSPLEASDFGTITMTLDTPTMNELGKGVIHRDLAVRNLICETSIGTFSGSNDPWIFSNDGPSDLLDAKETKPPIRWSAPESYRLYLNGDSTSGNWIDIAAGATLDARYVPAPSSLAILAGLAAFGRKRR